MSKLMPLAGWSLIIAAGPARRSATCLDQVAAVETNRGRIFAICRYYEDADEFDASRNPSPPISPEGA